jgi:hypothetical protein
VYFLPQLSSHRGRLFGATCHTHLALAVLQFVRVLQEMRSHGVQPLRRQPPHLRGSSGHTHGFCSWVSDFEPKRALSPLASHRAHVRLRRRRRCAHGPEHQPLHLHP